jgi:hypothetical protein
MKNGAMGMDSEPETGIYKNKLYPVGKGINLRPLVVSRIAKTYDAPVREV